MSEEADPLVRGGNVPCDIDGGGQGYTQTGKVCPCKESLLMLRSGDGTCAVVDTILNLPRPVVYLPHIVGGCVVILAKRLLERAETQRESIVVVAEGFVVPAG